MKIINFEIFPCSHKTCKTCVKKIKNDVMKTHDQAKKMNSELKKSIEAIQKWKDDQDAIKNSLKPDLFRKYAEQIPIIPAPTTAICGLSCIALSFRYSAKFF